MIRHLIPALLFILFAVGLNAQTPNSLRMNHSVGFRFGINQVKDENLHPKVSTGTITEFSYGFEKKRENLQRFQFMLGYSRLRTELEDMSKSVDFLISLIRKESLRQIFINKHAPY
jgi:hypothetical protein